MMKKTVLLSLFCLFTGFSLWAQNQATITEIKGKVEILAGEQWLPAQKGMKIALGSTVATGFNSTAKIELGDSTLQVAQLSRMKIEQLDRTAEKADTSLYLQIGKVKADVRSSAKLKHNFQFKSPVSTASVRGTSFTFTPFRLDVHHGAVEFANDYGQKSLVIVGGEVKADSNDGIISRKEEEFSPAGVVTGEGKITDNEVQSSMAAKSKGTISLQVDFSD